MIVLQPIVGAVKLPSWVACNANAILSWLPLEAPAAAAVGVLAILGSLSSTASLAEAESIYTGLKIAVYIRQVCGVVAIRTFAARLSGRTALRPAS